MITHATITAIEKSRMCRNAVSIFFSCRNMILSLICQKVYPVCNPLLPDGFLLSLCQKVYFACSLPMTGGFLLLLRRYSNSRVYWHGMEWMRTQMLPKNRPLQCLLRPLTRR